MRLLIISPYYSPAISPRAFRWTAIAEWLAARGCDVTVICAWQPGLARSERINGVAVTRVGAGRISRVRLADSGGADGHSVGTPRRGARRLVRRILKTVHDLTWKVVYWPDSFCLWWFPAVRAARATHAQSRFNAMITVSLPFTSHLVGLAIRKACRDMCWIADAGDPFSFHVATPTNNHILWGWLSGWVESRLLAAVDAKAVTTQRVALMYREAFPRSADKVVVIPPMLIESKAPRQGGSAENLSDGVRLVYAGVFYPGLREAAPIIALFAAFADKYPALSENLEAIFYGEPWMLEQALADYPAAKSVVRVQGIVPRETVLQTLASAHGLINIGNTSDYQLPSKVVEYAATGKPILNLCSVPKDTSLEVLEAYPLLETVQVTLPPDDAQVDAVARFVSETCGNELDAYVAEKFVAPYTVPVVAESYLRLISGDGGRLAERDDDNLSNPV